MIHIKVEKLQHLKSQPQKVTVQGKKGIIYLIFGCIVLLSCQSKQKFDKTSVKNKSSLTTQKNPRLVIDEIIKSFEKIEPMSVIPYTKGKKISILFNDKLYRLLYSKENWKIENNGFLDKKDSIHQKMLTSIGFVENYKLFSIINEDKYSIISTNLFDSTYSELKSKNPDFRDEMYGFYNSKNECDTCCLRSYFYEIVIFKSGFNPNNVDTFKKMYLIKLRDNVYYYRTIMNCGIPEPILYIKQ